MIFLKKRLRYEASGKWQRMAISAIDRSGRLSRTLISAVSCSLMSLLGVFPFE